MDQAEEKQKVSSIYNDFLTRLGIFRNKQLSFLKSLAAKKSQTELDDLRKQLPK